jgi:peroxiredoxin
MRAIAALCFLFAISVCRANDPGPAVVDLTGELRHPLDLAGKTASALIFYWHDCPICNAYAPEINRISERYTNFNFFIVQVDPDLTVAAAQRHAKDYDLRAPVLLDAHHALVNLAKATTAPEAIVFGEHRKVLYRGRIDNLFANLANKRSEATEHDLRDALDAISVGKPAPRQPPPVGCIIP